MWRVRQAVPRLLKKQSLELRYGAFELRENIERANTTARFRHRIQIGRKTDCRVAHFNSRANAASGYPVMLTREQILAARTDSPRGWRTAAPWTTTVVPLSSHPALAAGSRAEIWWWDRTNPMWTAPESK